ncbi:hypothetical protein [Marinifilum sp.]|uniref:hypothetical protein n=1 Tax=Marinifilum sp. TaxID=2033137 RepID=UPI003BAA7F21
MENQNKALEQIDFTTIVFIIGNAQGCFAFDIEEKVSMLQCSIEGVKRNIDFPGFLKINEYTLINSKFYTGKRSGRIISLKGGSMHKVSRNSWKHFKDMPAEF